MTSRFAMASRLWMSFICVCLMLLWIQSNAAIPECSVSGDPRGRPASMNVNGSEYLNIFPSLTFSRNDWVTKLDYFAHGEGDTYVSFWERGNDTTSTSIFRLKGKILFNARKGYNIYTVPYKDQVLVGDGYMVGVHYPDNYGTLVYERKFVTNTQSENISWNDLPENRNIYRVDTNGNWLNGYEVDIRDSERRAVALRVFLGCTDCSDSECRRSCPQNCKGDICNQQTAFCETGCKLGFIGSYCTEECDPGFFGEDCSHECSRKCFNKSDNICDPVSGNCAPGGCDAGYHGERCIETCSSNRFGKQCSFNCNCRNDKPCNGVTGYCENGCASGFEGDTCSEAKTKNAKQENSFPGAVIGIGVAAVLTIAALVAIVVVFVRKRRNSVVNKKAHVRSNDYVNDLESVIAGNTTPIIAQPANIDDRIEGDKAGTTLENINRSVTRSNKEDPLDSSHKQGNDHSIEADVTKTVYENVPQTKVLSHPIDTISFSSYITSAKADECKDLYEEFLMLPEGQTAPWDIARNVKLVLKNKFKNILPYDHNRVILHKTGNDDLSDYINASFVDGYDSEKKFIASHGPRDATKIDFWQMIWQYNVSVIVMVTNLTEDSKVKCIKYWPTDGIHIYGDISVTSLQEEEWQDYVVRKFTIMKNKEERHVTQFHYISWPDHGVPVYASGLLTMVHRTKSHLVRHEKAPVVVHCSAGVGRTGTFIALDWLLEQIQQEKKVDVLGCVAKLRAFRINMVQTSAQYIFIYDSMNETLLLGQTSIHCSEISTVYENMRESERRQDKIRTQFHFLEDTNPKFTDDEFVTAMSAANSKHNRDMSVLPADKNRVVLLDGISLQECYINAVMIQGYRKETLYYATQLPLSNTIPRFWCMIWRYKIPAIVVLEIDSSCKWYPEKGDALFQAEYEIQTVETAEKTGCYAYTIEIRQRPDAAEYYNMASEQDQKRIILLFVLKREETDIYGSEIINLYRELLQLLRNAEQSSVAVLCRNGAHLSGLYIACCILFDMVIAEQEFDVFQVVQKIRHIRPQFVASLEQYKQLYEIVKEFAAGE